MRIAALLAPAVLTAQALAHPAQQTQPPDDLIVTNTRTYTADEAHPVSAVLAVRDSAVQFVI